MTFAMKVMFIRVASVFGVAAILGVAGPASALEKCGETPALYGSLPYSAALYTLYAPCERVLEQNERTFVGGASQRFLEACKVSVEPENLSMLQKFLTSSELVGAMGAQYGSKDLGASVGSQIGSTTDYGLGVAFANNTKCERADEFLSHVVEYLKRQDAAGSEGLFVQTCAQYYSGQYSADQCQCIADIGASVYPRIHEMEFAREGIYSIIQANPLVGLQIGMQCGVSDY